MAAAVGRTGNSICVVACEYCRLKKTKCKVPNHGRAHLCYYPPINPRPRRTAKEKNKVLQEKLQRAQALIRAAGLASDLDMAETAAEARNPPEEILPEPEISRGFVSQTLDKTILNTRGELGVNDRISNGTLSSLLEDNNSQPLLHFLPSPQESYLSARDRSVRESSHECGVTNSISMSVSGADQTQNSLIDFASSNSSNLEPVLSDTSGGTTGNFARHIQL
ncbi:unnamed protein product [Sphagnum balticum]